MQKRELEIKKINLFTGTMKGTYNKPSAIMQPTESFDHCEILDIDRLEDTEK